MKPLLKTTFFLSLFCFSFNGYAQQALEKPSIIPQPVSLRLLNDHFLINNETSLELAGDQKELKPAADFFISNSDWKHSRNISDANSKRLL